MTETQEEPVELRLRAVRNAECPTTKVLYGHNPKGQLKRWVVLDLRKYG